MVKMAVLACGTPILGLWMFSNLPVTVCDQDWSVGWVALLVRTFKMVNAQSLELVEQPTVLLLSLLSI